MTIVFPHASPIGVLTLVADDDVLTGCYFEQSKHGGPPVAPKGSNAVIAEARRQLDAYFAGRLRAFDLPLKPRGTPFQLQVWETLRRIPFGETWSYGQLAAAIGAPKASRAVGAANGRNPIPVIVPCHRVIGADGSLTGFGGGMARKHFLLSHEHSDALISCA